MSKGETELSDELYDVNELTSEPEIVFGLCGSSVLWTTYAWLSITAAFSGVEFFLVPDFSVVTQTAGCNDVGIASR